MRGAGGEGRRPGTTRYIYVLVVVCWVLTFVQGYGCTMIAANGFGSIVLSKV